MTTKSKPRKAPAAKAVAPKAIPNERPLANKLTDAMDMLNFAKSYIECIYMAAASLSRRQSEPISAVADMASDKIQEAISLLEECNPMTERQFLKARTPILVSIADAPVAFSIVREHP